jgi:hypothetical protein
VEWKPRAAKEMELVALAEVVARAKQAVREGGGKLAQ